MRFDANNKNVRLDDLFVAESILKVILALDMSDTLLWNVRHLVLPLV